METTTRDAALQYSVSAREAATQSERAGLLWTYGLRAGVAAGVFNAGMVFGVAPESSGWLLAQVFCAWMAMGLVVLASRSGLSPVKHGMVVTVLLNLPWYINEAALPGNWSHLPRLVVVSLLIGAGFGLLKRRCEARAP